MPVKSINKSDSDEVFAEIFSGNYSVRVADTQKEIESALRLRYEVFNLEMAGEESSENSLGILSANI